MSKNPNLSSLQLELLKVYSLNPNEKELLEIKIFLSKMFAKKMLQLTNDAAIEKNISNEDLDNWLEEDGQ